MNWSDSVINKELEEVELGMMIATNPFPVEEEFAKLTKVQEEILSEGVDESLIPKEALSELFVSSTRKMVFEIVDNEDEELSA